MGTQESYKQLLRDRNLHATQPRISLLLAMDQYGSAIPHSKIHKSLVDVDRVTIYRMLEVLVKKGIIHKAYQDPSDTYYALCPEGCDEDQHNHGHAHLRCTACERVLCEPIYQSVKTKSPNWKISDVSVQIEGICPTCMEKE